MPRPEGTDGGDHKSRMIIEDRYRQSAKTKGRLKIIHGLLTLYLFTLCMWVTLVPLLTGNTEATTDTLEDMQKGMWTLAVIFVGVPTVMTTRRVLQNSYARGVASTLLVFAAALTACGVCQAVHFVSTPKDQQATHGVQIEKYLQSKLSLEASSAHALVHNTQYFLSILGVVLPMSLAYLTNGVLKLQAAANLNKKK
mmetsp:Transcript_33850/g.40940  ORF Transcript_33850/g.40940 Transcript_33850/m.40940 type:complete len:197 (-) Transcript_33850:474-1064(-)|eukprot:CAMPEP_0197856318 /NCGR_PEP_ID=MMETSP1438-20131217/28362_1 /TAXON_ID=1461541 /ORGANISM="Pterosperma sp., Strain CCMP1384" /LENGTH=196 /DNA_ID=CAMNT_0043471739 /DNA_START=197 /DNA_END=787 /DNA_ORIENTATION=+